MFPGTTAASTAPDTAPQRVTLDGEVDLAGFRTAARRLLQRGVAPDSVDWAVADTAAPELFAAGGEQLPPTAHADNLPDAPDAPNAPNVPNASEMPVAPDVPDASEMPVAPDVPNSPVAPDVPDAVRVPADFLVLCRDVVQHADADRFHRLFRLLWRLQREPTLRHDALDPELAHARRMAQAVRREQHKMKAFVRFREVRDSDAAAGGAPLHVAWFEPAHHVVEAVAPFFMRRFAGMRFAILTPERSVHWDGQTLTLGAGAGRHQAPPADAGEALWLTYYASIFNPARLKLRAMEKEMPRRYWTNLPEAGLISGLAAGAHERSARMVEREGTLTRRRLPAIHAAQVEPGAPLSSEFAADAAGKTASTLDGLRHAAAGCRECPLGALATQTVFGEGPAGAALMLVGEQPGDQEDLQGRPFVGPSGQLLARAMAQLGWPRDALYVTNAVKHFKYEPRGKRRIHKTPAQREADACLHWLESEIALVAPQAIVALGATAARQLLGRPVAVTRERGQWLNRADGLPVLVTLHPSALLRMEPADQAAAFVDWLADLERASRYAAHPVAHPAADGAGVEALQG